MGAFTAAVSASSLSLFEGDDDDEDMLKVCAFLGLGPFFTFLDFRVDAAVGAGGSGGLGESVGTIFLAMAVLAGRGPLGLDSTPFDLRYRWVTVGYSSSSLDS